MNEVMADKPTTQPPDTTTNEPTDIGAVSEEEDDN